MVPPGVFAAIVLSFSRLPADDPTQKPTTLVALAAAAPNRISSAGLASCGIQAKTMAVAKIIMDVIETAIGAHVETLESVLFT